MKLKLVAKFICITFLSMISLNQLSAQQYYKVVKGTDNPATAEQVDDNVNTINDVLIKYEINTSKTTSTKENYSFWVEFLSKNKLPKKRKDIIYNLLKQMKTELR